MASRWSGVLVVVAVLFTLLFAAAASGWAGNPWSGNLMDPATAASDPGIISLGSLPLVSLPLVSVSLVFLQTILASVVHPFSIALISMGTVGIATWTILRSSTP